MRKFLSIFVLVFSISVISQTYNFDTGSTQELSGNGTVISKTYNLSNSKNDEYSMLFYGNGFVSLFDKRNLTRNEFEVKSKPNEKLELVYLRSCDEKELYNKVIPKKKNWHFSVKKINDSIFHLNEYKRKNAKKPTCRTVIIIKESTKNHMDLLHKIDPRLLSLLVEELDGAKKYIIYEMEYYSNEVKGKNARLVDVMELPNYEVQLPDVLIRNESCDTHFFH